jgi:hypothetical protein
LHAKLVPPLIECGSIVLARVSNTEIYVVTLKLQCGNIPAAGVLERCVVKSGRVVKKIVSKLESLRNLGQILIAFKSACEMVKGVLR